MESISDISLVAQVAVFHNRRAFDQLVRKYQSPVRRFLLNLTLGNEALSDDLAQDTLFKGIASFQTWLFRIAYNVFYDNKRKTQTHPHSGWDDLGRSQEAELSAPPSAREGSGVGLSLDIHTALAILKEDERACVTLQLIEGYSIDEIANMLGMPANTVKSHLRRGKEKLTTYLKANGYDGNR